MHNGEAKAIARGTDSNNSLKMLASAFPVPVLLNGDYRELQINERLGCKIYSA
jgi:hypothetical protein